MERTCQEFEQQSVNNTTNKIEQFEIELYGEKLR